MTATNVVAAAAAESGETGRAGGRLRQAFRSRRLVAGTCIVGFFVLVAIFGAVLRHEPRTS